jgi:nucleotide-binding universal stress UspA family protein
VHAYEPPAEALGWPLYEAAARNRDAEAIYVGSRGAGRASALLGSVAHEVLHRADRPVTVVNEAAAARLH